MLGVIVIALGALVVGALAARHTIVGAGMDRDGWRTRCTTAEQGLADASARIAELEPYAGRVAELEDQLAVRDAVPDLDADTAAALLEHIELPPPFPGLSPITKRVWDTQACQHCGGLHSRACPRVRRIAYGGDGTPVEVEFWPEGRWPVGQVLWLEDVMDAAGGVSGQA